MGRRSLACCAACLAIAGCATTDHAQPRQTSNDGRVLVNTAGCTLCHALKDAGSSSQTGPDFDAVIPGRSVAAIRRAIVAPPADGVMPRDYGTTLTPRQIDALARYLLRVAGTTPPKGTIRVRSREFLDGQALPRRYTCDGEDVSPELGWDGVPRAATSLTLRLEDLETGETRWHVDRIPPHATGSGFNHAPVGGHVVDDYDGPCAPHRYRFTVTALRHGRALARGSITVTAR